MTILVVDEGSYCRRSDVDADDELVRHSADNVDAFEQHDDDTLNMKSNLNFCSMRFVYFLIRLNFFEVDHLLRVRHYIIVDTEKLIAIFV